MLKLIFRGGLRIPFLTQDQEGELIRSQCCSSIIIIQAGHLKTTLAQLSHIKSQTVTLAMQDLGRLASFAYKYEGLVLGEIAAKLLVHDSLKTLKLLAHIDWLHTQVILQIIRQLTNSSHKTTRLCQYKHEAARRWCLQEG